MWPPLETFAAKVSTTQIDPNGHKIDALRRQSWKIQPYAQSILNCGSDANDVKAPLINMPLSDIQEGMVLYGGAPNLAVNDVLLQLTSPGKARARARPNAKHPLIVLKKFSTYVKTVYVASFGGATALANVPGLKPEHHKYFLPVHSRECDENDMKEPNDRVLRLERGAHPKRSWVCALSSANVEPQAIGRVDSAAVSASPLLCAGCKYDR